MRDAFPEHFVGEAERQQKLWSDCIFVLDTNVLLDLYRFSDSAREALFKVMESLGERLWIPYQVAVEYFENRLAVIEAQSKAYAESIAGLKVAKEKFNSGSRHPFVSDEVFNQFISSYDLMIRELEDKQKTYLSFIGNDIIKAKIGDLLNGRVGQAYSEERLLEVAADGEKRFLENIPPGFEDGGKMPEATTNKLRLKKFGDLILWKQLIEKAAVENKPVILVTGEKKDDWWLKSNKGLVSALPALTKEFMEAVKQDFYLYATDRFLLKANDYLKQSTSDVVVEEVRAINKADSERDDNSESTLLDNSLRIAWHKAHGNSAWSWLSKGSTSPWLSNEADLGHSSELNYAPELRGFILERGKHLRAQLGSLQVEREELLELQRVLFRHGVSADDKKYEEIDSKLSVLDSIMAAHQAELAVLRGQMQTIIARYKGLSTDGMDE